MRAKAPGGTTAVEERRRQQRYPLELPADLRLLGKAGRASCEGWTCDISATGLYLRGEARSLGEGSRVEVSVRLPAAPGAAAVDLHVIGRVVRVDRRADQVGLAVSFDSVEFSLDELESFT
ncbi:MAG: PilZ domain-containing protein [Acidobacteria bacterium]|nr:PilZ domain-containing protein [Acidobacteriota bacterium]